MSYHDLIISLRTPATGAISKTIFTLQNLRVKHRWHRNSSVVTFSSPFCPVWCLFITYVSLLRSKFRKCQCSRRQTWQAGGYQQLSESCTYSGWFPIDFTIVNMVGCYGSRFLCVGYALSVLLLVKIMIKNVRRLKCCSSLLITWIFRHSNIVTHCYFCMYISLLICQML